MNAKRPTPTLHDVAAAAQVSTATVSRCLNFPDQVAQTTRDKVLAAVERLGYSPNFGARAMAARRTNTIGAIIPTMENAIFARGLQAFQEELRAHGFTMLVASTSYDSNIEDEQIRSLVARGADALLLIGHERDPAIYRFLDAQAVPYLITWAFDPTIDRPSIGFNNRQAMFDLAAHVIALGHVRLGFISAQTDENDRASERLAGIRDAMRDHGLHPDDLSTVKTEYGVKEGADAFDQLMAEPVRPTAVLCGNDVLAVGAMQSARRLGVSVPHDVSIVGFDDMDLAQIVNPPLTSIHVPHQTMGRLAGQALAQLVKDGLPLKAAQLPTELIMRGTLSKPKII